MNNFISQENKGLLWDLLNEKNIFLNIPNQEKENVQSLFEKEIEKISVKANSDSDLLILNKLLIQNFTSKLSYYKQNKGFQTEILNNDFENKKKEFNEFINTKKPEEIKFEKELDKPLDQNELDFQLDLIQKQRNELLVEYDKTNIPLLSEVKNDKEIEKNKESENLINKKVEFKLDDIKLDDINLKEEITNLSDRSTEKNYKNIDLQIINEKLDILSAKIDLLLNKQKD